ncbi:MAG: hypothetical protein PF447_07870 [Spirochaetaceae bacterium]|nr:hypothetical protein [Spirochaetaceae bacterium]
MDENLSIGESVILNNNGENIQLLSLNGDGDLEIPIIEDPVLQGDDLFSIDPYRQLTLWSSQGESLYSIEFPMLLTAYDFREDYFFGGFINGEVSLYKEDRLIQNIRPGGSRIQAIYGLAIGGADASLFGLISGLDPQRILIYEKKSQEYRPVFHDNLEGEFRRPVIMGYSQRGNYFYYEEKDGLSFIYLKDLTKESMPLSGRLVDVYFPPEVDNPLILSKGDNRYYLSSYLHGKRIFYRQLSGEFLRLYPLEDSMLLVLDNQILNMKWSMQ